MTRARAKALLATMVLAAACSDSELTNEAIDEDGTEPSDVESVPYERHLAAGEAVPGPEGRSPTPSGSAAARPTRTVRVNTGAALEELVAEIDERNRLVYEGDIVLGNADELDRHARAGFTPDKGKRWEGGVLYYS